MAANKGKKVVRKRRERKNVERGQVHIRSSFNNTMVTVTDAQGNAPGLGQDLVGAGAPNAVDISEADLDSLLSRQVQVSINDRMGREPCLQSTGAVRHSGGFNNESQTVREAHVREVQSHHSGASHLDRQVILPLVRS